MTNINPYLTFNGNCSEAMHFYKSCIGGELMLQKIGESPVADQMPQQMKECILHASLAKENLVIMASDCVGEEGLQKGNNVSLCINCSNEEEIRNFYAKLSAGGKATHPLTDTFWGALFGGLTDKFGIYWLLNYDKRAVQKN